MKYIFILFNLFFLLLTSQLQAQDPQQASIKTQKIKEGLYLLQGRGGNIAVQAGEDGVFLVDDELAPLSPQVEAAIKKISSKPVKFVLNTHWHYDHTGGNLHWRKKNSLLVAHQKTREHLSKEEFIKLFNKRFPANPKEALPVVTFSRDIQFFFNGDRIKVRHLMPAHTDGDAMVYFKKAGVVHLGDIFINGSYPFIDQENGGALDGVIASVEEILKIYPKDAIFIPGHGPIGNRKDLQAYLKMLQTAKQLVKQGMQKHQGLEALQAAKPLQSLDAQWGGGLIKNDQFVGIIYQSLKGKKEGR